MKNLTFLSIALLLCCSALANNPMKESEKEGESLQMEINDILKEISNEDMNLLVKNITPKNKVIIMDGDFNKIWEEYIDENEEINNQTMLVPILYRTQFIAKIYNVSYYMLQKNK